MRRRPRLIYFILFLMLLGFMSLSKENSEKLRGGAADFFSPIWRGVSGLKSSLNKSGSQEDILFSAHHEELQQLRLENSLLRTEILHLKEGIQHELRLLNQLTSISERQQSTNDTANFLKKRHRLELQKLLQLQLHAIPGHVIYRPPSLWNSSFWIDVGTATNDTLGTTVVAKNSPVLYGTSVIGVIDYVGHRQSRVRLLTDSSLNPSVRVLRSSVKTPLLVEKIYNLIHLLEKQKGVLEDSKEQNTLIKQLEATAANLATDPNNTYLAKGELHGSSKPLWREQRHLLKGSGFNYDFADGEGEARDLRTGKASKDTAAADAVPIIKKGDLLITTGMDGVFPPDLLVAEVVKVHSLKEGDYYYDIDALPTAGNLDDISLVFVIPPMNYDPQERVHTP